MLMLLDYIASGPQLAALATSSRLMLVTRPQEEVRMNRVTARVTRAMVSVTPIRGWSVQYLSRSRPLSKVPKMPLMS